MIKFFFSFIFLLLISILKSQVPCDSIVAYFDSTCINVSGGTSPYSFIWIDNNNGFSFICNSQNGCISDCDNYNFCPGNYSVVIQDANQCTTSVSFLIDNINLDFNLNTLHIDNITGGVPSYEINWYQNNFLLDTLVYQGYNLCNGNYFIEIIDSEFCIDTFFFEIDSITANFNINTLTIENIEGGTSPYSFFWSKNNNDLQIDNYYAKSLCEGSYSIVIYDINQCFLNINFTIDPLTSNLDPTIECSDNNFDSQIVVEASGGVPPYTYLWDHGVNDNMIDNLSPGVYRLDILDNFGCYTQDSIIISPLMEECVFNVFTPNNDGLNDFWKIDGSFLFPESKVFIYNRYGRKVFESTGNNLINWNGLNLREQKLSEGIYYYVIILKNNITPYKGFISLFY